MSLFNRISPVRLKNTPSSKEFVGMTKDDMMRIKKEVVEEVVARLKREQFAQPSIHQHQRSESNA